MVCHTGSPIDSLSTAGNLSVPKDEVSRQAPTTCKELSDLTQKKCDWSHLNMLPMQFSNVTQACTQICCHTLPHMMLETNTSTASCVRRTKERKSHVSPFTRPQPYHLVQSHPSRGDGCPTPVAGAVAGGGIVYINRLQQPRGSVWWGWHLCNNN